jgi:murein DD-endopeptidase MepM/ murein hydrolase activator NlpD
MQLVTKFIIFLGSAWNFLTPAHAALVLPKQERVPGGVAIIKLDTTSNIPPSVRYMGNRTLVMRDPNSDSKHKQWLTVIGIPLDATLGVNSIDITTNDLRTQQTFVVQPKKYRSEKISLPNHRKVEPLAEDLPLIDAQYQETIQTYAIWQDANLDQLGLQLPVRGRKSSPFGLTRIFNDIPKMPHSGLDIAAPQGTAVACPKAGRVINTGNYFFSGNIVFVDHGQGFITSYCHLDTIAVHKDQVLQQGDLIGTVGKTGRASGPHLHWSVSLNGARVNPQLFIHG